MLELCLDFAHHCILTMKQLIQRSQTFPCEFHSAGEMLCFYVIMQQERLFKVSAIYLSHFFSLTLSGCVLAHSTFSSQPLTHSLIHLSLFTVFSALCSFYASFNCTKCLVVAIQSNSALHNSSSEPRATSHLPVGRAVHNSAIKSPKNVEHDRVCELSQHLQIE